MVSEVINMSEENKHSQKREMPSKLQKLFRKRWVFPAIYLAAAALVVTTVLWLQNDTDTTQLNEDNQMGPERDQIAYNDDEEAVPTVNQQEVFAEPVADNDQVEIKIPFYDQNASADEQEAALVFYNNTYYQNQGIDYSSKSGEPFDVTSAMSGNVVKAEKDGLLGHVVEIEHQDGVTSIYQSLKDVSVKEGDTIEQGDVIGQAGQNAFNKDAGIHVHFEIRKNGVAVNPIDYFGKSVTAVSIEDEAEASEDDAEASEDNEEIRETETPNLEDGENQAEPKDASSAMTNA